MLASWMNLMPLFVVRWMALRYCERVHVGGLLYVIARPDVLVRVKPDDKAADIANVELRG
jgi:hypothetical protein